MSEIIRGDVNEELGHSGYVVAGDFVFVSYCIGDAHNTVEEQIKGALDMMEARLKEVGLSFENLVKVEVLLRNLWNIPIMEDVFKQRFNGKYPARKTISTEFACVGDSKGLEVQIGGVAYKKGLSD